LVKREKYDKNMIKMIKYYIKNQEKSVKKNVNYKGIFLVFLRI